MKKVALGLLVMLLTAGVGGAASLNHAAAFRWHGYMDTNLAFSEFIGGDHTVTAWFMLQYPNAYDGPVLTVNGTGRYFVGQGDYRHGVDAAKLRVAVGDAEAYYTLPSEFSDNVNYTGKWKHVALVRKRVVSGTPPLFFWSTRCVLYLDGVRKEKDGGGDLVIDTLMAPNTTLPAGTVRLGTGDPAPATSTTQFYGFVDDVAVFDRALTVGEIQGLYGAKRLTGIEADLHAGYTFDTATPSGSPLPPSLSRPVTIGGPAYKTLVSQARSNATDAAILPLPQQPKTLQLPFMLGQVWKVSQGWGGAVSHNGYAGFAYDFVLAGLDAFGRPIDVPNADGMGQPLMAATDGNITAYGDAGDQDLSDGDDRDYPNYVHLETAPLERLSYRHVLSGSASQTLMSYGPPPFHVEADTHLADVGYGNSYHLHLSAGSGSGVTHPHAFSNYEYYDAGSDTWVAVSWAQKRVPRQGQYIRRPYPFGF